MRLLPVIILASAGIASVRAATVIVDFDSGPPVITTGSPGSLMSVETFPFLIFAQATAGAGMSLQSSGVCWPGNGTVSLSVPAWAAPVIRHTAGVPFTLWSLDLAEYSCVFPGRQPVSFTAGFPDGREVRWDVQLDGISDFGGPADDFQRVELPSSLSGASWLRLDGNVRIDNLVLVTSVPEPFPAAALASVLSAGLLHRRARRRAASEAPGQS